MLLFVAELISRTNYPPPPKKFKNSTVHELLTGHQVELQEEFSVPVNLPVVNNMRSPQIIQSKGSEPRSGTGMSCDLMANCQTPNNASVHNSISVPVMKTGKDADTSSHPCTSQKALGKGQTTRSVHKPIGTPVAPVHALDTTPKSNAERGKLQHANGSACHSVSDAGSLATNPSKDTV